MSLRLGFLTIICVMVIAQGTEHIELGERVLQLLRNVEQHGQPLNVNMRFSLILGDFLIKEKSRFYESTRYEAQTYFRIQQKLHELLMQPFGDELTVVQKHILKNIFRKHVMLVRPSLKELHINKGFETNQVNSLIDYNAYIEYGVPNATLSDECLASIATLDANKCLLRVDCLNVILTDLPTYGYQRLHQILLLYVLMHHECSMQYATRATFELMAATRCTQVYEEQRVIREHQLPPAYRDLYLEQNVICGLFGFVEFLNWHNMELLLTTYTQMNGCFCLPLAPTTLANKHTNSKHKMNNYNNNNNNKIVNMNIMNACSCSNHMNALALVYYINGLLLLE